MLCNVGALEDSQGEEAGEVESKIRRITRTGVILVVFRSQSAVTQYSISKWDLIGILRMICLANIHSRIKRSLIVLHFMSA